jgi:hypothetical protein
MTNVPHEQATVNSSDSDSTISDLNQLDGNCSFSDIDDNSEPSNSGHKIPVHISQMAPKVVYQCEKRKPVRKM